MPALGLRPNHSPLEGESRQTSRQAQAASVGGLQGAIYFLQRIEALPEHFAAPEAQRPVAVVAQESFALLWSAAGHVAWCVLTFWGAWAV